MRRFLAVPGLLALLTGCTEDPDTPNEAEKTTSSRVGTSGGYGDILVAGEPVTGSEPSDNEKVPYQRIYTDGELYAPVTGYRSLAFGSSGLESIYEDSLKYSRGEDVETTIDPAVQEAAFAELGGERGAAIALNAETGDLLAVVSTPSYDPTAFAGNTSKDQEAWKKANDDPDEPMLNRPLREATAPGETFNIVIAAAALENGLYDTVEEPTTGGTGQCANATIRQALARSCDAVFVKMADDLGEVKLRETAEKFGFNDANQGAPQPVSKSTYDSYQDGDITVTPLQLARVAASLADRGELVRPRMAGVRELPLVRSVSAATADQLFPAVRDKRQWAPTDTGDGDSSSWSLAYTTTAQGDPVALVARVTGPDTDEKAAIRATEAMTEALS
ncbi:penicillin-binding transpeptidase domain-containing protein [Streptomyces capitiformicae]|uniref:penicillin-binding transpeptidase domain-containing protein n=1 Tax=Streptomyces capitiformicae TaxID=2014920 RepID=UPI0016718DFF|nr:penicillin-binding transpeptidase domain-containing protein [Streptomyces capitiformicae]